MAGSQETTLTARDRRPDQNADQSFVIEVTINVQHSHFQLVLSVQKKLAFSLFSLGGWWRGPSDHQVFYVLHNKLSVSLGSVHTVEMRKMTQWRMLLW